MQNYQEYGLYFFLICCILLEPDIHEAMLLWNYGNTMLIKTCMHLYNMPVARSCLGLVAQMVQGLGRENDVEPGINVFSL